MKNISTKEQIELFKNFYLFYISEESHILLCEAIKEANYENNKAIEIEKVFYRYYKEKYKPICDFWGKESYGKYVRIEFIECYLDELVSYHNDHLTENERDLIFQECLKAAKSGNPKPRWWIG